MKRALRRRAWIQRGVVLLRFAAAATLGVPLLGLGCGGIPEAPPPGGGTATADLIGVGPITGFGSAFVNEVQWDLTAAMVDLDGATGTPADLRHGMIVRVSGRPDAGGFAGTATSIEFDHAIEGPLEGNPTVLSPSVIEFTILDTRVVARDGVTFFGGGARLGTLASGDEVAVSGVVDDTGSLVATRVTLRTPSTNRVELRGTVTSLMRNLSEFAIGGVTVVYDPAFSGTAFTNGLAGHSDLRDGQTVEVVGRRTSLNRVEADVIELEVGGLFGEANVNQVMLRGFVTRFTSPGHFAVSGTTVDASSASLSPASLVVATGAYVEVIGRLIGGTIRATLVEAQRLDDRDNDLILIRASVPVNGVGAFGPNTLGMLAAGMTGVEVQVPASTRFEDTRSGVAGFSLTDVSDGDWLEIRGYEGAGGAAIATWIERRSLENDVVLQGPVTFLDAPSMLLSIQSRSIFREAGVQYFDVDGGMMLPADFFTGIAVDDVVRAVDLGALSPASLALVDRLSIEKLP